MLSLSKKVDYALLALSYLTRPAQGRVVNTKEIAEEYDIPGELLAKILQKLAKANLLVSTPGPTGGYRLARSPESVSVGAIVQILDGPPAITQCMRSEESECEQHDKCTIRIPLLRVNARILEMLHHISLAEICQEDAKPQSIPLLPRTPAGVTAHSVLGD